MQPQGPNSQNFIFLLKNEANKLDCGAVWIPDLLFPDHQFPDYQFPDLDENGTYSPTSHFPGLVT